MNINFNIITGLVFFFVVAIGFFAVYAGRTLDTSDTNLKKWGAITAWQGIVWPALYFNQDIPMFFTHIVAPFTLVMTLWGYLTILRRHLSQPPRSVFFLAMLALLLPLLIIFVYFVPNPDLRKVSVSTVSLVFLVSIVATLVRGNKTEILPSQRLMAALFIFLTGIFIFRTIFFILGHFSPQHARVDRHDIDIAILIMSMFCCIISAYTYILMCSERHYTLKIRTENEFRMVRDNVPVMIWTFDTAGKIAWQNRAWLEFTGEKLGTDAKERWHGMIHAEDRARVVNLTETARTEHRPYCTEYRLRRKDGVYCWVMETGLPLQDDGGNFRGYVGSTMDVTIAREMESAIAANEARLRTVFDVMPVGVVVLDQNRKVVTCNRTLLRILKLSEAQLKTGFADRRGYLRSDGTPLTPEELPSSIVLKTGAPVQEIEVGFLTDQGEIVWTLVSAEPLPEPQGGIIMSMQDISERKRHLLQIESLSQELIHAAEKERAELAGELHDAVGQSLVFAALSIQEMQGVSPEQQQQLAQPVRSALEKVRNISHRLSPIHLENLGMKLAVEDLLHDLQRTGKYEIVADLDALPYKLPGGWNIDFYRIVQEALTNIIKHARASRIEVVAEKTGSGIVVEIRNDGRIEKPGFHDDRRIGMGMLLMQERAKSFHGSVQFNYPSGMFIARVEIPLIPEKSSL